MEWRQRHSRGCAQSPSQAAQPGQETSESCMEGPQVESGQRPGRIRGLTQGWQNRQKPSQRQSREPGGGRGGEGGLQNQQWAPTYPPAHPSWWAQDPPWGRQMPDNGLGGQHLSVYGHGAVLPGPARPSVDSQAQWLSQAGRQFSPFRPRAAGLASPAPLFLSGSCK